MDPPSKWVNRSARAAFFLEVLGHMAGVFQTQHGMTLLLVLPLVGPVFVGLWLLDPTFLLLLPDGALDHGFQDPGPYLIFEA